MGKNPSAIVMLGATGFLGSRVARQLVKQGARVCALTRGADRWRLGGIESAITWLRTDEPWTESKVFDSSIVVNASVAYQRPGVTAAEVYSGNCTWPMRVFTHAIERGAKTLINFDSFYSRFPPSYGGMEEYIRSKRDLRTAMTEVVQKGGVRYFNVVLGHLYGPKDSPAKMLPEVALRCLRGDPSIALTGGEQQRDFLYIEDAAAIVGAILGHGDAFDSGLVEFECGGPRLMSLREVVQLIRAESRATPHLEFGALPYRSGEVMRWEADQTQARRCGWHPRTDIIHGIREMVRWFAARTVCDG